MVGLLDQYCLENPKTSQIHESMHMKVDKTSGAIYNGTKHMETFKKAVPTFKYRQ